MNNKLSTRVANIFRLSRSVHTWNSIRTHDKHVIRRGNNDENNTLNERNLHELWDICGESDYNAHNFDITQLRFSHTIRYILTLAVQ